jgi:hypothetical protein
MWSLLREVRALRFDARSEAATGWNGIGLGTVVVSEPMVGMIVFAEAGTWQSAGRTEFSFNNVFRWSAVGEVLRLEHLRLEHLRFGPDNPVLLFDMAPGEDGVWREVSPHQCRDDCYTASLGVEGRQLLVEWSIRGPRKRESIRYT